MTSNRASSGRRPSAAGCLAALGIASSVALSAWPTWAAEASYPFEGTWVRANRACTATAPLARTYSAREVTGATTHCLVRKVAAGSGQFEIFEECRRSSERAGNFTETIRMLGSDAMVVRRQAARLKLARPLRYIRCTIAAPSTAKPVTPHHPAAALGEDKGTAPKAAAEPEKP